MNFVPYGIDADVMKTGPQMAQPEIEPMWLIKPQKGQPADRRKGAGDFKLSKRPQ